MSDTQPQDDVTHAIARLEPSDIRQLRLEQYEGPLDLLLTLVRRREVDILQIPIAEITGDYLLCLEYMRDRLSLEVSGDFLAMASVLVHLKSRHLLPEAFGLGGHDDDEDDAGLLPRTEEELAAQLMQLARFQDAAEDLWRRPVLGRDTFVRDDDATIALGRKPLPVNVVELANAFREIVDRNRPQSFSDVRLQIMSIPQAVERILAMIGGRARVTFGQLVTRRHSRADVVQLFCATLELARWGFVRLSQDVLSDAELELEGGEEPDQDSLDRLLAASL